ncbi:hypothetical protein [Vibrio rumoiensis]|uniref:C-type lysozyme inhibitor domain-containing protein n=1 Tax=Vibrio rumoiensis 1S-45 TaxID=1188252 RepID=A0A1E5DZL9_9VIBR|nr:hypothetical protein [Vibrio rumoiensis]OEF22868.1 hypothetical protein A1QC_13350 [Vibrio rumoiensis 1S-45]
MFINKFIAALSAAILALLLLLSPQVLAENMDLSPMPVTLSCQKDGDKITLTFSNTEPATISIKIETNNGNQMVSSSNRSSTSRMSFSANNLPMKVNLSSQDESHDYIVDDGCQVKEVN